MCINPIGIALGTVLGLGCTQPNGGIVGIGFMLHPTQWRDIVYWVYVAPNPMAAYCALGLCCTQPNGHIAYWVYVAPNPMAPIGYNVLHATQCNAVHCIHPLHTLGWLQPHAQRQPNDILGGPNGSIGLGPPNT